ncbi:superoxide dismutase, Cu-Zn family [Polaromonas sp. YR568]|uniref:superoxide dismutase family protein n=1 Tax=Polaromonas sp. YR568 TaxID=1855301 RepID=UPI0008E21BD5|nr:superoxide dismutase family protein [Polaromonas sp. YR568]SFU41832.1 superoxide dismutase, Cu-Zn family [Polaromonas sp. YR568]
MNHLLAPITAALVALVLGACASTPSGPRAVAQLQSTTGNTASGTVSFVQSGGKVLVSGEIRGLKPGAEHGFHVHEKGDCSSGDGMSAGGHFNPTGQPHGSHADMAHHTGDLPSLKADASGNAKFSFESSTITVGSGATDIVGKGLIVHRDPDDYKTQPTGNAGPRLACAVIARA